METRASARDSILLYSLSARPSASLSASRWDRASLPVHLSAFALLRAPWASLLLSTLVGTNQKIQRVKG